jgi:hypothetical protein
VPPGGQSSRAVDKWVIDAEISDLRIPAKPGTAPLRADVRGADAGPATLAARLHKSSKDTVDRALKELVGIGTVIV